MSMRSSSRWALLGLLAAISLPFLAVAKPPDLPVRATVECEEKPAQPRQGSLLIGIAVNSDKGTPYILDPDSDHPLKDLLVNPEVQEQFKGVFCPGIDDLMEACWRALL